MLRQLGRRTPIDRFSLMLWCDRIAPITLWFVVTIYFEMILRADSKIDNIIIARWCLLLFSSHTHIRNNRAHIHTHSASTHRRIPCAPTSQWLSVVVEAHIDQSHLIGKSCAFELWIACVMALNADECNEHQFMLVSHVSFSLALKSIYFNGTGKR